MRYRSFLILLLWCGAAMAQPADHRPRPYPVLPESGFLKAVEKGTRTLTGAPGPNYWTNRADYTLRATLVPSEHRLEGAGRIVYRNDSPDTLMYVVLHLRQNIHRPEAPRRSQVPVTEGMEVRNLRVNGVEVKGPSGGRTAPGWMVSGTLMTAYLPSPLLPGRSATLDLAWTMDVPPRGAPRMGYDGNVFFLGYWYPQMAVYDDVRGWVAEPYLGMGEFYMGYGDYDVAITLPEGWLVGATGTLRNPGDVLAERVMDRLSGVAASDAVVPIITEAERGAATRRSPAGTLTWRFQARNVRDFAFGASNEYVWDAVRANVSGGAVLIHALYRPEMEAWTNAARYGRFTIEHMSERVLPYPYPQMTLIEGVFGGGMEYPMITIMGPVDTDRGMFGLTYHETAHMWFPMIVGSNETNYAWMDEGLTVFNSGAGAAAFYESTPGEPVTNPFYVALAGTAGEVDLMRPMDLAPNYPAARLAAYNKPAMALQALQGLYGKDRFLEAFRTYARHWAFKHPYPYDFFNTVETVLGEDLDWFWTPMFYETWTLDQAVSSVVRSETGIEVTIADRGLMPMPALVRVTYSDGRVREGRIPVDAWLSGARSGTLRFEGGDVLRVDLDPEGALPDIDRSNNTWQPPERGL